MANLFVKKNDTVLVIAGAEKGKTAKVLGVSTKDNRVLLDGVNVVSKHQKPRSQQDKGGIIKKNAPIDASNVMVICPDCNKATRVKHSIVDGKKVRVCAKCGASLDKKMAKQVKKSAKSTKSEKVEKVEEVKPVETVEAKPVKKTTAKKATTTKTATKSTTVKKTTAKKAETK